ncbi:hypothetical protein [Pseudooceanicola sp. MF1-13]|uniref:hypothetical protein n=1 Tax=Pseudooceanicola sp. MF1-13 TaxID=3379095 RepID=UPI00389283E2
MTDDDNDRLLRDIFERVQHIPENTDGQWFDRDEVAALRGLAEYSDDILADYKMRRAKQLIFREWRAAIVAVAMFVSAVVAFRDDALTLINTILGAEK